MYNVKGDGVGITLAAVPELSWDLLEHRRNLARLSLFYETLIGGVALPVDKLIKQDTRTRGRMNNFKHKKCNKNKYQTYFFQDNHRLEIAS